MIRTVPYKGSKKKLLSEIESFCTEISAQTVLDGFSGTGVVSAHLRSKDFNVDANDISPSSSLYGRVFLNGFDQEVVDKHIEIMNSLQGIDDWLTANYSGEKVRKVRGKTQQEKRPLAFKYKNSTRLDSARNYIETLTIDIRDKEALIFSVILAANSVMNITNDQKSSLKEWTSSAEKDLVFVSPTNISGHIGQQYSGDIFSISKAYDLVYLDPPYTSGVLYPACYHLNDSIVIWDKPSLDHDYALPRPQRAIFNDTEPMDFFSKKTAIEVFDRLIKNFSSSKRIVLSYSDAPRNSISLAKLEEICSKYGKVSIVSKEHRICVQPSELNKISSALKEYFFVVDTYAQYHTD